MKKYITFDSVAYPIALITFVIITSMLGTACLNLKNKVEQKRELKQDVHVMFNHLEKPLAFDGMFLDDSES